MKKSLFMILALAMVSILNAQPPEAFKYQAIARDASGSIITNQPVAFQLNIVQGSTSGTIIYTETHLPTTNNFGLVNLEVGNGNAVFGDFTNIDWSVGPYFLQVEIDETGGTNYQLMGTTQLLSVPYALFAERVKTSDDGDWLSSGNDLYNSNTGNVGIGTANPDGKFVVMDGSDTLLKIIDGQIRIPGNGPTQGIAFMGDEVKDGKGLNIANGLFRPAPNTQAIATGSEERLRITSSGDIGIGTLTPQERLEVNGGIRIGFSTNNNPGTIRWTGTQMEFHDGSQWLPFSSGIGSQWSQNGSDLFYNSGNVGIGSSSPTGLLSLSGIDPYLTFDASASSNEMGMRFSYDGIIKYSWDFDEPSNNITFNWDLDDTGNGDIVFKRFGDDRLAIRNNGDVLFKRYGDDRLAIRGDGNVGIGTATPTSRLTIFGDETDIQLDMNSTSPNDTQGLLFAVDNIEQSSISLNKATNDLVFNFDADDSGTGDIVFKRFGDDRLAIRNNGDVLFKRYGDDRLAIKSDGNVGIGTSNPTRTLDINGEAKIGIMNPDNLLENIVVADPEGVLHIRDAATLGGGGISLWMESGPDIYNINPGMVGIGTPMPTHTLDVMGEARIEIMNMNNSLNNVVVADEFGVLHIRDAFTLGGFSQNIKVDQNGNVGIGTDKPTAKAHIKDVLRLEPRATFPPSPEEGDIFVHATEHNIYCFLNGKWQPLIN